MNDQDQGNWGDELRDRLIETIENLKDSEEGKNFKWYKNANHIFGQLDYPDGEVDLKTLPSIRFYSNGIQCDLFPETVAITFNIVIDVGTIGEMRNALIRIMPLESLLLERGGEELVDDYDCASVYSWILETRYEHVLQTVNDVSNKLQEINS